MSENTNKHFKITVPITRCYLRKAADGTEKYVVEGMASNTNMDLTGERMAESAIEAMSKSLASHAVVFKNEHGNDWDDEFGEVVALTVTGDHRLMMEAELDPDHYRTKTLVAALNKGRQLGLSIGGLVVESAMEYADELKRLVRTYTDILLQEISVTGTPAVADTWLTNINKSIRMDDTKEPMPTDQDVTTETPIEVTPTDPQPEVESIPEPTEDHLPLPTEPDAPAAGEQDQEANPDGESASKSAADQAEAQLQEVEKSLIERSEEVVQLQNSLSDKDTAMAEVTKTRDQATTKVDELTKALTGKDEEIAALTKSAADTATELETTKKSLTDMTTELATIKARKGFAVGKFGEKITLKEDGTPAKKSVGEAWLEHQLGVTPERSAA